MAEYERLADGWKVRIVDPEEAAAFAGVSVGDFTSPAFDEFEREVYVLKLEEAQLLVQKHKDYGPRNIANAPGGALVGLAVRLWDKVSRLHNLATSGASPQFEGVDATGQDIANYGTITTMVARGLWPGA